jgi:penicillin G amidase
MCLFAAAASEAADAPPVAPAQAAQAQITPAEAAPAAEAHVAHAQGLAILSGELEVRGLLANVNVLRDRWGVAHIYAANAHDLFFAQGVVASQDRLFQMELWKRAGQGTLSEVLGPSALQRDVNARALQYRGDMDAEYASYSPQARAILAAFTDGINAYIATLGASGQSPMPAEFQLAGFAPDRWRPQDCLNRMAAFSMTGNARRELWAARALSELGPAKAAKLFAFDPPTRLEPAPGLDLSGLSPELLANLVGSDRRIEFAAPHEGSNNWTISGMRTASGAPLLANDPHRVLALPSLRYMVHLVAPGWNVIGAGEPGLPGVALGHNEQIAWGFTIFGLDQQDLYVEELNPANPLEYRTATGWATMATRREVFRVKGSDPQTITLRFTRHGPVLWQDGKRALALRWVGNEPGTAGYLASLAVDQARNWSEFEAAMPRWKVPSENIVYADRAGNIGEHSVGLAPIRSWTGLLPVPGEGGYEWQGFLPASKLPHAFNPQAGFVASANQKMIPDHYPYMVGFEWEAPYRFERVRSMIEDAARARHKLTIADMESMQSDVVSLPARELQKLLRTSELRHEPELGDFLRWDGSLTRESAQAAVYELWLREISRGLGRKFSETHTEPYERLSPDVVLALLASPDEVLFGNNPQRARDALLLEAWRAARNDLSERLGPDSRLWAWGKFHVMQFRHPLDQLPGMRDRLDPAPLPRPGDGYTVNATGYDESSAHESWQQVEGASYREILDPGDWDRSQAVNAPGQSGQPGSRHYDDLLTLWDSGQYFPLVYSRDAVEAATVDRLLLRR